MTLYILKWYTYAIIYIELTRNYLYLTTFATASYVYTM